MGECFNRTLGTQLAILTSRHQRDWDCHLLLSLWSYTVQEPSCCKPVALMLRRELSTHVGLVSGAPPEPEITGGAELD